MGKIRKNEETEGGAVGGTKINYPSKIKYI